MQKLEIFACAHDVFKRRNFAVSAIWKTEIVSTNESKPDCCATASKNIQCKTHEEKLELKRVQGRCAHCDCTDFEVFKFANNVILTTSTKLEIKNVWKSNSETPTCRRTAEKTLYVCAVSQKGNASREYENYMRYLIRKPPTRDCERVWRRSSKQSIHQIHDDPGKLCKLR